MSSMMHVCIKHDLKSNSFRTLPALVHSTVVFQVLGPRVYIWMFIRDFYKVVDYIGHY